MSLFNEDSHSVGYQVDGFQVLGGAEVKVRELAFERGFVMSQEMN